jgi:hypothetical protein
MRTWRHIWIQRNIKSVYGLQSPYKRIANCLVLSRDLCLSWLSSFVLFLISPKKIGQLNSVLFIVTLRSTAVRYMSCWGTRHQRQPVPHGMNNYCTPTSPLVFCPLHLVHGARDIDRYWWSVGPRLPANRKVGHKARERQQWNVWG